MSHNQYPPQQPPGWGPQPPTWGAPPPRPPRKSAGQILSYVILSAVGVCLVVGAIGLAFSSNDDTNAFSSPTSEAPLAVEEEPATGPDEALEDPQEQNQEGQDELDAEAEEEAAKDGEYSDGDYLVGEDMPSGTYTTAGAKSGIFEFCSITTEPTSDTKFPQLKAANADERIIITLSKEDGVVTIQGCEPLTLRK